jgi:hypothetical protein
VNSLPLILTVFVACAVEATEALTIVLASGLTREWRSTFQGMAVALVVLAVVVAAVGPALTLVPLAGLRLVVGALLAIFGVQWLRKAILRATGHKSLHDEASAYLREVAAAKAATVTSRRGVNDWYAFTLSFKGVLLEGLEVVFIVITFGDSQRNLGAAVIGAAPRLRPRGGDRHHGDGYRGTGPAGAGPGECDEVRGGDHAHLVRPVLGSRRRRRLLAGQRRVFARARARRRARVAQLHPHAAPAAGNHPRGARRAFAGGV